jgi:hypothetical protein
VSDWYSAVRAYDASDPNQPFEVGDYDEVTHSWWTSTTDGYAFSAGYTPGAQVLDISNPRDPRRVATWPGGRHSRIVMQGDIAFRLTGRFQILDATDMTAPIELGVLDIHDSVLGMAIHQNYAYIGTYDLGLLVVDISDLSKPRLVNSLPIGPVFDVAHYNGLLYLCSFDSGLHTISTRSRIRGRLT